MDDFHHVLGGIQPLQHILTDGLLLDARDEILHHAIIDVGFQQRQPNLPCRLRDVILRQPALFAQLLEEIL